MHCHGFLRRQIALAAIGSLAVFGTADARTARKPKVPVVATLATEDVAQVELRDRMPAHWVVVNDVVFTHILDGRAYVVDADKGEYLGMVPGGHSHIGVQFTPDGSTMLMPGTFFSRGSRGDRTDVITWFALKDLMPGAEVVIPPKRMQSLPLLSAIPLTDDGRFMLIYNFTPEQTMTVVDVAAKSVVGEFETPGCALAHMTGPRSFMMQCADGSLQSGALDEGGKITLGATTPPLFEREDPATDKPVRVAPSRWLFITFSGAVLEVDNGSGTPVAGTRWKLTAAGEEAWRPGGLQPYAFHAPSNRLYVLMHEGGPGTHKHPGTEIWVFDASTRQRVARLPIETPSTAIAISNDADPLLYTTLFGSGTLVVRKPADASVVRKVEGLGADLTLIQVPPVTAAPGAGQ
ncbi:methylamine dehydrogenase heavy subunit (plasmid) [Novosphingobium aromaticivorans DSM 12444]|uniref:Methylamine dehydrogenase heavy subunit n=1 Tax=Novosphingobium aromaticivorans (strain ATCC 700278 / DSM 12444 / CCUG 56034 / CIP 105152 / NBRC 16084 / F199) TaxID=279238 RepID=A4XFG6_NOVAD|nr:methylamine dehydrogenase heavy subunit [Novosphingobium aromaticivorans DSM 12444]SCY80388.1 methylamine dehydrogenase heavy chain [Novosphingobium aromaticivorans]